MKRRITIGIILSLCAALLCRCALEPLSQGGGTDFPNTRTVMGTIAGPDGEPATRVQVLLAVSDFNPVVDRFASPILTDTTDSEGAYRFAVADTGEYTISAVQLEDRTRALITGIHVDSDTVRVAAARLQTPGAIAISLSGGFDPATGYVYIPGTSISARVDGSAGFAILDSVPAGTIPAINYGEADRRETMVVRHDVSVLSGDTSLVRYPSWKYAKKVFFNTTPSGAGISATVTGFPVLIRLSPGNFAFAQAQANGDDLRFAKNDGTPLLYEIEEWNTKKQTAAIWVRVDTLFGNSDTQSIMMYWGASSASEPLSNSAAVFDTALGFQAVWHLSGPTGFAAIDATANGYHGAPRGNALPGSVTGIIGSANVFNGTDFYEMPGTANSTLNFPEHGIYSVSAWVNMDSLAGEYQMIASKGDKQYNLQFKGATKNWQFTEYQDMTGWDETASSAVARAWVHLVGVRAGEKQYLYVNGVCTDSTIYTLPFSPSDTTYAERRGYRNTSCNFMIGKKVDYNAWFFKGIIDEVRVSSRALSPEWIKLCYMNQRSDDRLVVMGR